MTAAGEVRLRPVAEEDLVDLERMYADPEAIGIYNWGGWQNPRVWRRRWEEDGLIAGDRNVLIITDATNEMLGSISWRPV